MAHRTLHQMLVDLPAIPPWCWAAWSVCRSPSRSVLSHQRISCWRRSTGSV